MTNISTKLKLYKWGAIILILSGLTIFSIVQYYQIDTMQDKAEVAAAKIDEQAKIITNLNHKVMIQGENINNAITRLENLREVISDVSRNTKELSTKVDNIPSPSEDGQNAKIIEDEINKLSDEILQRIRDASKGKNE